MSSQMVIQQLQQIEAVMREHGHWQTQSPEVAAFASTEPFVSIPWSRWSGCSGYSFHVSMR